MGARYIDVVLVGLSLLVALATAPAPASAAAAVPPPVQVLVLDLEAIGLPVDQARLVSGRIADVLGRMPKLQTLTAADLKQLADLEATRQTVGCDDVSCLGELASAMGARYVVFGRAARVEGSDGDSYLCQLNLFDAESARPVARHEWEARDPKELLDGVEFAARTLVTPITGEPPLPPEQKGPSALLWTGIGLGGTGAIAGVGFGIAAAVLYAQLGVVAPPGASAGDVEKLRRDKAFAQDAAPWMAAAAVGGLVLGAVGGALIAVDVMLED